MRARGREEEGQVTLVLLVVVLALFAAGLGALVLGEGSDQRGKAQKAADAAALAAGVEARNVLVRTIMTASGAIEFTSWSAWSALAGAGCAQAPRYAASNSNSVLTSCTYFPAGRVRTTTDSEPSERKALTARAAATADVNAPTCTITYVSVGLDTEKVIVCAGVSGTTASITVDLDTGAIVDTSPESVWRSSFKIRLVA
jgi:hypothetical protein